jgi:DNA polymerase-3 subunit delta'
MRFGEILGQGPALQTLTRALETGRAHHAYRFEGPPGVGKQLAALCFARALVCEVGGLGCEKCSACRRAVALSSEEPNVPLHPDVVFVARGLYRSVTGQSEASGIGVEQIRRVVLERIGFAPHEGRAMVFIVHDADELTPQAANALLKTLEEPPARTHFVLVTSRPKRLLDTIRSRTLPVRFGPLSTTILETILTAHQKDPKLAAYAEGSASLALLLADEESFAEREAFVRSLEQAIDADDFAAAVRFAESRKGDRDTVKAELGFFAQRLSVQAKQVVRENPQRAELLARRHAEVLSSMIDIERNMQPALALETLLHRLRQV